MKTANKIQVLQKIPPKCGRFFPEHEFHWAGRGLCRCDAGGFITSAEFDPLHAFLHYSRKMVVADEALRDGACFFRHHRNG